jgi:AraC family transcriptional regulator
MYFTALPDHSQPGFDEKLHFSKFGRYNIIYNADSEKSHCDHHVGCLSMKTVLTGEECYKVNNRRLSVKPTQFLVLNEDQEYASSIDDAGKVRVLSVFFGSEFASSVYRDILNKEEVLLDTPFDNGRDLPEFFQTLTDMSPGLQQNLHRLISSLDQNGYDVNFVDEQFVFLLRHLIRVLKDETSRSHEVIAIKANTRKEIYRRLCIAKDFLHAYFMDKPDLLNISQAACLSRPQLIRQFKAVFHESPHQYLVRIRLQHAVELLRNGNAPVREITWKCGFENSSAFCRAFRVHYGISPFEFRKSAS